MRALTTLALILSIIFSPTLSYAAPTCSTGRVSWTKKQACLIDIASNPMCEHVTEPGHKKTCGPEQGITGVTKDIVFGCAKGIGAGATALLDTARAIVSYVTDSKFRASKNKGASQFLGTTGQVLGNEYVRAQARYQKNLATRFVAPKLAALEVSVKAITLIGNTVLKAVLEYDRKTDCMSTKGKWHEFCKVLTALLIPTAGLLTVLKLGPKGLLAVRAQLAKHGITAIGPKVMVANATKNLRPDQKAMYQISRMNAAERKGPREKFFRLYKNDPKFAQFLQKQKIDTDEPTFYAEEALERYAAYTKASKVAAVPVPTRRARTVDLRKPEGIDKKTWNASLNNRDIPQQTTGRQLATLELSSGDKVKAVSASGKQVNMELGEFIGSGNTTHIFDLKNAKCPSGTDCVVRVPFYTEVIDNDVAALAFNKKYVEGLEKYQGIEGIKVPKVIDHGKNYEYIVMEKIKDAKPLSDYFDELSDLAEKQAKYTLTPMEETRFLKLEKMYDDFEPKAQEIAKRSGNNGRISATSGSDNVDAVFSEARQVLVTQDSNGNFIYHLADVE